MKNLVLYGAGGVGAEIAVLVEDINRIQPTYNLLGFVVDTKYLKEGMYVNGYPVLGDDKWLLQHKSEVVCCCAIGTPSVRKKIQEMMESYGVTFETLIHPTVRIHPTTTIGVGTVIAHYCGVSVQVSIGKGCFMNGYSAVGHDVKVGEYSVIMARCQVSGFSEVGNQVMLGAASFINSHIKIGDEATVVPGSIVFTKVKPSTYVMGNPAHKVEL